MKKIFFGNICLLIILLGCGKEIMSTDNLDNKNTIKSEKVCISVSILPEETFVKVVGKNLVDVFTMIPPGASPANYQPTTKQMLNLSNSRIYFSIGVPTEKANIIPKLKEFNKNIKLVSLNEKVEDVYKHRYFEESREYSHGNRLSYTEYVVYLSKRF